MNNDTAGKLKWNQGQISLKLNKRKPEKPSNNEIVNMGTMKNEVEEKA